MSFMAALLLAGAAASASAADATVSARVIVKFKASTATQALSVKADTLAVPRHAQALSQRIGLALTDGRALDSHTQVVHAQGLSSAQLAARLAQDSEVEYAVVDQRRQISVAPNDPLYAAGQTASTPAVGQWYLRAPTASVLAAINAEGAWAKANGAGVVVAVLDTGVRFDHPDLTTKLYPGYDFISDAPTANDGDVRDSDASDPGDWVSSADVAAGGNFTGCTAEDSSWHGTQTAGLIGAATNNGIGMAGVGGDVMVLPLRVLGKCGGFDSDIIAAMNWAVGVAVPGVPANTHPAKVLNLSLGSAPVGASDCVAYDPAIATANAKGAIVVVSAGNDGLVINVPAKCSGAIAVAGVRHAGTKVGYSSLGPQASISAPAGNCVTTTGGPCQFALLTTTNSGTTVPATNTYSNALNPSLGTSFSAPMVAGTAALMFSAQPGMTPANVLAALQGSARTFPNSSTDSTVSACKAPSATAQDECFCTATTCGAGLLDASAAVAGASLGVQARVTLSNEAPSPSQLITLSGASSFALSPRTITSYQWSLVSGGGVVTAITSNGATATAMPTAAGRFIVSLKVTDATGAQSTTTRAVDVQGSGSTQAPAATSSSGGGGGALGPMWLLGLGLGVIALALLGERNRRLQRAAVPVAARRLPR